MFQGFTEGQMQLVADNTSVVQQREREIAQIVRSIQDLNDIFKDLATFVVDQVRINSANTERENFPIKSFLMVQNFNQRACTVNVAQLL